ncbi:hypothetical protein J7E93_25080 [Streptomyces sp. ISL-36]|uniref:hypothetical protein n=1 Tax=Streptomyces sp. ISL-36 TaxID=2819182 RepID=UPI001BED0932|nr:hypothetical protein [Streptomyces sp. ISL-36]MBT2443309.1 hypothetical protein [Streptomyces sp. ISL-36]
MTETAAPADAWVDLGAVTAPSGVLVLCMAGWIDHWPEVGRPLSERAREAATHGGGHLYGPEGTDSRPEAWTCEAIAVPAAADRVLPVRARTSPSPFDGEPTVSVLEVDLGLPRPEGRGPEPVLLGDLPVDRCGMVLGDARALDSFVGLGGPSLDGLADLTYWGRHEEEAHAEFGGERIPQTSWGDGPYGRLDLPLAEAEAMAERLEAWLDAGPGKGLVWSVEPHTHLYRLQRAGWPRPLLDGLIDLAGCRVLGLGWDAGDHSVRHHAERAGGGVFPATLEAHAGTTVLRWTIPPWSDDDEE